MTVIEIRRPSSDADSARLCRHRLRCPSLLACPTIARWCVTKQRCDWTRRGKVVLLHAAPVQRV